MKKYHSLALAALVVAGCESTPFMGESAPPVRLLSDEQKQAAPVTPPPAPAPGGVTSAPLSDPSSSSATPAYTPPVAPSVSATPAPVAGPGIPASRDKRFREIPLPENLREDTQRTFVYDSRTVKIGKMVYYSKHSINELAQFYIDKAPLDGWSLLSTTQSEDSVLLFFVKPGKRLNVESRRGGVGRSNELILNYLPAEEPVQ